MNDSNAQDVYIIIIYAGGCGCMIICVNYSYYYLLEIGSEE